VIESAFLEVRLFPWRPRQRLSRGGRYLDGADFGDFAGFDDLAGLALVVAIGLLVILLAPVLVVVLGALLFSLEVAALLGIAVFLVLARFAGLLPWTVVVVNRVSGEERRESVRTLVRAVRRVREVNGERRVHVRWAWS
jgi:hypothetical protein